MNHRKKINIHEVKDFIERHPGSRIYLGCDSERIIIENAWYADYASVIVVHIGGSHGCKVFGQVERERDYDQQKGKPRMRLMNEVYKVSALYLDLMKSLENPDVDCQIHLDINPSELYGSSCVVHEAIGYVRAMTNVVPMVKPYGFAASHCADRLKELKLA